MVEATRGDVVEARHRVHAVAVSDGTDRRVVRRPALVTFFRSSAKPIQALPVVRARPDLDDAEIAIACASHLHRPDQLEPVRRLLAKARRDGGRPRVRARADAARAQLLREARRDAAPLPRARLADRGLPARGAPVPAGDARRGRRGGGGRADVDADRRRRLRRRDLRAHARADGARVLAARVARRRSPRRRRDARASRADPRRRRAGHRAHAARRRLGREGRRRGAPLRGARRARHRAQGRGRRASGRSAAALAAFLDAARARRGRPRGRSGRELARRGRRRAPRHRTGTAR